MKGLNEGRINIVSAVPCIRHGHSSRHSQTDRAPLCPGPTGETMRCCHPLLWQNYTLQTNASSPQCRRRNHLTTAKTVFLFPFLKPKGTNEVMKMFVDRRLLQG
ncbi:uncharacterized protein O3C94_018297 [Discoglossus pictus]